MYEIIAFFYIKESESESESEEEEEDEEESPVSPAVREERSPLIETEVVQRPTITVRKNRGYL